MRFYLTLDPKEVQAKELRDKKREALSHAATLAISAVQARVKNKVLKFNAKQKERKYVNAVDCSFLFRS